MTPLPWLLAWAQEAWLYLWLPLQCRRTAQVSAIGVLLHCMMWQVIQAHPLNTVVHSNLGDACCLYPHSTGWDPKDARELDRGQVAFRGSPEP